MAEARRTEIKFFPRITVRKSNSGWQVDERVRPGTEPVIANRVGPTSCCNGFRCFLTPLVSGNKTANHVSWAAEAVIAVNDALEYQF